MFSPLQLPNLPKPPSCLRSSAWCQASSIFILNWAVNSPHKLLQIYWSFYIYNFLIIFLINRCLKVPVHFYQMSLLWNTLTWTSLVLITSFPQPGSEYQYCSICPPVDKSASAYHSTIKTSLIYSFSFISSSQTSQRCLIKNLRLKGIIFW